ncbi:hypothetical protein Acr_18g0009560 [Actinidia rufa]|uniref:RNase H type-1 domain-containing protein n=1 Tax=Actinidia rufa TaxID=165716 RepID=A0A7J0G7L1_9ERIC|nr:hypothetical protein Acr_18g0009560 [Actinidia rufa]
MDGLNKINFDGAYFKTLNAVGIGIVVRNHRGEVTAALSEKLPFTVEVDCMEALSAAKAIQFAKDLGIFNVHLEGASEEAKGFLSLAAPSSQTSKNGQRFGSAESVDGTGRGGSPRPNVVYLAIYLENLETPSPPDSISATLPTFAVQSSYGNFLLLLRDSRT